MEVFLLCMLCISVIAAFCGVFSRRHANVTEIYIPFDADSIDTARERLQDKNLRGCKIIICRTAADEEDILRSITEAYGKVYRKG